MRVIGGRCGGIRLLVPRDRGTRPVTDRVKEMLFGILGERVVDARVADLYAGSGALGIEALSRGARHCDFVERGHAALEALVANVDRTRLVDRSDIHRIPVERFLAELAGARGDRRFDLVLLDPPYAERAILPPLERLLPYLAPGATVVVKHFWRTEVPALHGLWPWRSRRVGETALSFLEHREAVSQEEP